MSRPIKFPDPAALLSMASVFVVGTGERPFFRWIMAIMRCDQGDGTYKWALELDGEVWSRKLKEFVYHCRPSSRNKLWYKQHRFNTLEEAWKVAQKALAAKRAEDVDTLAEFNARDPR